MDIDEIMRNLTYSNQEGEKVYLRGKWYSNWYNGIPSNVRPTSVLGLTRQVAFINGVRHDNPSLTVNKGLLPNYYMPTWFSRHNQNNQFINYYYYKSNKLRVNWNRDPNVVNNSYLWHADLVYGGGHKYNYSQRPLWKYDNSYVRFNVAGMNTDYKHKSRWGTPGGVLLDDVGIMGRFEGNNSIFEFNNLNPVKFALSHDDKWHGHSVYFFEINCNNSVIIFNILSDLHFGPWKYRAADTGAYFFRVVGGSGNWVVINVFNTTFKYDRLNSPIHNTKKYNTLYNFWGGGTIQGV